jgi:hypothetical protein
MSAEAVKRAWALWSVHYLKSLKGMTPAEAGALLLSYIDLLQDIPDEIMEAAALQCIAHCDWLPTVHQVREEAVRLVQPSKRSAAEAWISVRRLIRQGAPDPARGTTDRVLLATIEAIGWKRLRYHDEADEAALFAQFRDTYTTLQSRQREALITPPQVHQILSSVTERKSIRGPHADHQQISDKSRT